MRLLLRATYQHNSTTVVGPPLASYLVRNKKRFYFSHDCSWCPLQDLIKCLFGEQIRFSVKHVGYMRILENKALDYLCRPSSLEDCAAFEFFKEFYKAFIKVINADDDILPFENTADFDHPSYIGNRMRQGVVKKCEEDIELSLVHVIHYWFPDTAEFNGCIFDTKMPITEATEQHALLVLTLCHPF